MTAWRKMRFLVTFAAGLSMLAGSALPASDSEVTFEADIRGILKAHCFQCHGEADEKKAGLDLRLRRFIVKGGESGPAIELAAADESLLLERVRSGEMPPGDKRLSENEIAKISAWIKSGAMTAREEPLTIDDANTFTDEERSWWSFQPVVRPTVPSPGDAVLSSPIDAFVLTRLREALGKDGHYTAMASRETLIRRAAFDLTGLPPTPEQIDRFLTDDSRNAWSQLVDRLLASPHYGEHWGRHWLDVAGYADSEGYSDEDRVRPHAYRYRDYVIRALNADKPFDQFVVEQLAGDELVASDDLNPHTIELLTATGFLRMAPDGTASSGIDQGLARNQVVADTLQIVGTSLLGLTVNCAQCHDHRYDPIPQTDYYRMRAVFEPALDWKNWKTPAGRQISLYTDVDRAARGRIEAAAKKVDAKRQERVDYYMTKTLEQELLLVDDELQDPLRTAYRTPAAERTKEQTALLDDHPSIAKLSPGALYLYDRRREARAKDIEARRAVKEQQFIAAAAKRELARLPNDVRPMLEAALVTSVENRSEQQQALLEQYPSVIVTADTLASVDPDAAAQLDVYTKAAAEIRKDRIASELKKYADDAAAVRKEIPQEHFVRTLRETAGSLPQTFFFFRGDHDQPKQALEPAGLSVLGLKADIPVNDPEVKTSGRRLNFARHLTNGQHPLVARVFVNRVWLHHFGRGLVDSPGDFGVLGERPTHPDLLDWLAAEFVASGWSIKHLHRVIMNSTVYQQSATGSAALHEQDPDNRWFGRMSVQRLQGETLRDAILAVSGRLNAKLHGEPVPVMEDAVGQIVIGKENLDGERKPTARIPLHGEEFRRSLYVQVRRTRPLAVLETFDAPNLTPNCVRRVSSNVASQSLLMMNSDFAVNYADFFAERLQREQTDLRQQVMLGWRLAYGTEPDDSDLQSAVDFIKLQQTAIASREKDTSAVSKQSLASFCQALLSSNGFMYVR